MLSTSFIFSIFYLYFVSFKLKQEGQHPLTGQRAANFKLLANQ